MYPLHPFLSVKKKIIASVLTGTILTINALAQPSVTFPVSPVQVARFPLKMFDGRQVMASRLDAALFCASPVGGNGFLASVPMNGFAGAVFTSYADHRPLVLCPDDLWMLICQGFSIHVNKNFTALKSSLFLSDQVKTLVVRNDSLPNANPKDWDQLIHSFADSIRSYTRQDLFHEMMQQFSTTTETETVAYEVTLMESVKQAFSYVGITGCGIPSITLQGTLQDWQQLEEKVKFLKAYGMEDWMEVLQPVLHQFTEAYQGRVDVKFWQGLFKEETDYGKLAVNGWIIKFFPYLKRDSTFGWGPRGATDKILYVPNPYIHGNDYYLSDLVTGDFPSGFATVPVKWVIVDPVTGRPRERNMNVSAGFFGMLQDTLTMALKPYIGWAVSDQDAPVPDASLNTYWPWDTIPIHHPFLWMRGTVDSASAPPVYAPAKNNTADAGLQMLKKFLEDSLKTAAAKAAMDTEPIVLQFVVSWDGTVVAVKTEHPGTLEDLLPGLLSRLPYGWNPAVQMATDMYNTYPNHNPPNYKYPFVVNYRVKMTLFDK